MAREVSLSVPAKFDRSQLPVAPDFRFETALWDSGLQAIAGIDEAGRGALAGPVSAAVVIFPADRRLELSLAGVRDSKQMTPAARQQWAERLPEVALAWAVDFASAQEIDERGIVHATHLAVLRALARLSVLPEHLLLDYLTLRDCSLPQTALVKGDARSLSIAAASIFAKTSRDALMRAEDVEYPGYGFAMNKGYGTLAHRQAILRMGYTTIHRRSFGFQKDDCVVS